MISICLILLPIVGWFMNDSLVGFILCMILVLMLGGPMATA